jgi:hypothetical protein
MPASFKMALPLTNEASNHNPPQVREHVSESEIMEWPPLPPMKLFHSPPVSASLESGEKRSVVNGFQISNTPAMGHNMCIGPKPDRIRLEINSKSAWFYP